jgi:hypothetical protein
MRGYYWYVLRIFYTPALLAGKRKLLSVSIFLSTFSAFLEAPPSKLSTAQLTALAEWLVALVLPHVGLPAARVGPSAVPVERPTVLLGKLALRPKRHLALRGFFRARVVL